MKKILLIAIAITLLCATVLSLTGCIFKNGSIDEVPGIYGVQSFYYSDADGNNHNYAGDYDYFLLVIYEDKNVSVIYKKTSESEVSYNTSCEFVMKEDDGEIVQSVKVKEFFKCSYDGLGDSARQTIKHEEVSLTLYPKLQNLSDYDILIKRNSNNKVSSASSKLAFHKIYSKTTEKKIDKAKEKQIEELSERAS